VGGGVATHDTKKRKKKLKGSLSPKAELPKTRLAKAERKKRSEPTQETTTAWYENAEKSRRKKAGSKPKRGGRQPIQLIRN